MRQHVLPLVQTITKIDFIPTINITTLHPTELYGSKIKALLERGAARDLYDVYNFIHSSLLEKTDNDLLRKIILFYQAIGGDGVPNEQCDTSKIDHLQFKHIRAQLLPMLRKGTYYDFETAKTEVKHFLLNLMTLTENERPYGKHVDSPLLFRTASNNLPRMSIKMS